MRVGETEGGVAWRGEGVGMSKALVLSSPDMALRKSSASAAAVASAVAVALSSPSPSLLLPCRGGSSSLSEVAPPPAGGRRFAVGGGSPWPQWRM